MNDFGLPHVLVLATIVIFFYGVSQLRKQR